MCLNEPCWSLIKRLFIFIKRVILSGMWSYKRPVLNSICKTNSPGRWEDSYTFSCLRPAASFFLLFVRTFISNCDRTCFLPQSVLHHLCPFIREGFVEWVGTLWRWMRWLVVQLGVAVVWGQGQLERSEVQDDGCVWQRPQGTCVWAPIMLLSQFWARLPFCHSPVTLCLPARKWLATLFTCSKKSNVWAQRSLTHTQHRAERTLQLFVLFKVASVILRL